MHRYFQSKQAQYFWLFIFIHTLLWTIGPWLTRASLPHDTLEGITWGLEWQLSYPKHPFLTAWLSAGITQLFGTVEWPVYFLAQVAISITFIATWQLAKKILLPEQALFAVLALDGVLFYNINSFNLTPDTLQSPLWALLSLYFYQAITTQKIKFWLWTGILGALCVCTKYQALLLLAPMLLLCVYSPVARNSFKKRGIYLALTLFLVLLIPHVIWLFQHNFITLNYAKHITSAYTTEQSWFNYLKYPFQFILGAAIAVVGLFILLWPFYNTPKIKHTLSTFQWHFLISVGLGPLLISFVLCILSGDYFPPRWLTPYFFALGIMMLAFLQPVITPKNAKRFAITLVLFSSLLFLARIATFTVLPRSESDAFLPNKKIALSLSQIWQKSQHTSLAYIAGSSYLIASITPYMLEKPQAYLNWDAAASPWINEHDLRSKGAIFVWDQGTNYTWDKESATHTFLSPAIIKRFPNLKNIRYYTFYRQSDQHPIIIGVALLPPDKPLS